MLSRGIFSTLVISLLLVSLRFPSASALSVREDETSVDNTSGGIGKGIVLNQCTTVVYYTVVHASPGALDLYGKDFALVSETMELAPGSLFEHPFEHDPNYGVSVKLQKDWGGLVSQLEWTWNQGESKIYYDLSRVDGAPFMQEGEMLTASGSELAMTGNCRPAICQPGEESCEDVYNLWNDDRKAMRDCGQGANILLTLCSGSQSSDLTGSLPNSTEQTVKKLLKTPRLQVSAGSRIKTCTSILWAAVLFGVWYFGR